MRYAEKDVPDYILSYSMNGKQDNYTIDTVKKENFNIVRDRTLNRGKYQVEIEFAINDTKLIDIITNAHGISIMRSNILRIEETAQDVEHNLLIPYSNLSLQVLSDSYETYTTYKLIIS